MPEVAETNEGIPIEKQSIIKSLRDRREIGLIIFTVALLGIILIFKPGFLNKGNIASIILWVPLLLVMSAGQMMAVLTRGIDVSVGSIMGLSAMTMGLTLIQFPAIPLSLAILIALGVGGILGFLNGFLISFLKLPPIIITLGTLNVYRGLCFIIGDGRQINSNEIPSSLTNWSIDGFAGVPYVMIIAIITIALTWFFLSHTRTGRSIYAIGSNPEAASLLGLPVTKTLLLVYTIGGILAGLGGVLYASRFGAITPGRCGDGYELTVIAATVIGGVQIRGGVGSIFGVIIACFLLAIINVALASLGVSGTWQLAVYGLIILLAIVSDSCLNADEEAQ